MSNLSLTNSVDIVCNSLKLIQNNDLVDVFNLFLLKSEGANIVGLAPSTLNTLQEIANAIGDDADFFNTINGKIDLKMNISDVYSKSYIDILSANLFTKDQTTSLLSLKLDSNIINSYYNKTVIDNTFTSYYTKSQVDGFVNAKINIADVYNKISVDSMLALKLNITDYLS